MRGPGCRGSLSILMTGPAKESRAPREYIAEQPRHVAAKYSGKAVHRYLRHGTCFLLAAASTQAYGDSSRSPRAEGSPCVGPRIVVDRTLADQTAWREAVQAAQQRIRAVR